MRFLVFWWFRLMGHNEVQARWKTDRVMARLRRDVDDVRGAAKQVAYRNKNCRKCKALISRDDKECYHCGASQFGWTVTFLERLVGKLAPQAPLTGVVMGANLVVYFGMGLVAGGLHVLNYTGYTLVHFGGMFAPMVDMGQWWRMVTSVFLHANLIHLLFNSYALMMLGPAVEHLYPRSRVYLIYFLSGVFGSVAVYFLGNYAGVLIGASSALSGLVGLLIVGGHKMGTAQGKAIKAQATSWAVSIAIFGLLILPLESNIAHLGGFVMGAFFGYVTPRKAERTPPVLAHGLSLLQLVAIGVTIYAFVAMIAAQKEYPPTLQGLPNSFLGGVVPISEYDEDFNEMQSTWEKCTNKLQRLVGGNAEELDKARELCSRNMYINNRHSQSYRWMALIAQLSGDNERYEQLSRIADRLDSTRTHRVRRRR